MTRGKKLLILVAALALVSVAAWGIIKLTDKDPTGTLMTGGDVIFTLGDAKLLSWTCGGEEFAFDLTTSPWTFLPDESYQISDLSMRNIMDAITQVKSRKSLPLPEDLSQYGLDEPMCTITVNDTVMQIGSETALTTQYYLYMGGDQVYLVDAIYVAPFTRSLADMTVTESIPNLSQMQQMQITTKDETISLRLQDGQWYLGDAPAGEKAAQIAQRLDALQWFSCVNHKVTDLSPYGLDAPQVTYELTYLENGETKSFTLLFGSSTQSGVYAMIQGSQMVYQIASDSGTVLTNINSAAFQ